MEKEVITEFLRQLRNDGSIPDIIIQRIEVELNNDKTPNEDILRAIIENGLKNED